MAPPMSAVAARKAREAAAAATYTAAASSASSPSTTVSAASNMTSSKSKSRGKAKAKANGNGNGKPAATPAADASPAHQNGSSSRRASALHRRPSSARDTQQANEPKTPEKTYTIGQGPQVVIPLSASSASRLSSSASKQPQDTVKTPITRSARKSSGLAATPVSASTSRKAIDEDTPSKRTRSRTNSTAKRQPASTKTPTRSSSRKRKSDPGSEDDEYPEKEVGKIIAELRGEDEQNETYGTRRSPAKRSRRSQPTTPAKAEGRRKGKEPIANTRANGRQSRESHQSDQDQSDGDDDAEDRETIEDEGKPYRQGWVKAGHSGSSRYFVSGIDGSERKQKASAKSGREEVEMGLEVVPDSQDSIETRTPPHSKRGRPRKPHKAAVAPEPDETGFLKFTEDTEEEMREEGESEAESQVDDDIPEGAVGETDLHAEGESEEGQSSSDEEEVTSTDVEQEGMSRGIKPNRDAFAPSPSLNRLRPRNAPVAARPPFQYSQFTPQADGPNKNFVQQDTPNGQTVIFGMKSKETLALVGITRVTVLRGQISICGALLRPGKVDSLRIFVPADYPIPSLTAFGIEDSEPDTLALEVLGLGNLDFDAIVRLEPDNLSLPQIGTACPVAGPHPFALPGRVRVTEFPDPSGARMLFAPEAEQGDSSSSYSGLASLELPDTWEATFLQLAKATEASQVDRQENPIVALVTGAKKVGKSTFVKMAVNRLLSAQNKVAVIDLDLGQSEFGPPGSVSLHLLDPSDLSFGPGWCLPRAPVRSHFFGDTSPKDDPGRYLRSIQDIIAWFRCNLQRPSGGQPMIPLVVNTQGWTKGLGADLAMKIETMLRPSHIYEIVPPKGAEPSTPAPTRGQPYLDQDGAMLATGASILKLEGAASAFAPMQNNNFSSTGTGSNMIAVSNTRVTAADSRTLSIMSYLHATRLADTTKKRTEWDLSRPLLAFEPLVINVRQGLTGGIHVLPLGSSVPDRMKLAAINASLVAIVAVPLSGDITGGSTDENVWKAAFAKPRPTPEMGATSLGLGLVRSVDPENGQVHLVTPAPLEVPVGHGLALVKGAFELPIWASLDFETVKQAREGTLGRSALQRLPDGTEEEERLAGVPRSQVPYLEWPESLAAEAAAAEEAVVGSRRRKIRRNLMRKAQA